MKTVKIFLASSEELEDDREAFQGFLYQKTKLWKDERGIFLEMKNWENFIDAVSQTRLQDEYNKTIRESDIFVMLFWTKVGKYTEEEFDVARTQFKESNKPLIYTYFKRVNRTNPDQESLFAFKEKLNEIGHYETLYNNTEGLLLHFNKQLDQLYPLVNTDSLYRTSKNKMNKQEIIDLIDSGNLVEAFAELNKCFSGKNAKLNTLIDEFVNPPNNYSHAQFVTRLKVFVNKI